MGESLSLFPSLVGGERGSISSGMSSEPSVSSLAKFVRTVDLKGWGSALLGPRIGAMWASEVRWCEIRGRVDGTVLEAKGFDEEDGRIAAVESSFWDLRAR